MRPDWRTTLRKRIVDAGLTPVEVSRLAGLGRSAVRDILERGVNPSVVTLAEIAKVLNTTLADLLEGGVVSPLHYQVEGVVARGGEWIKCPTSNVVIDNLVNDVIAVVVSETASLPGYRANDVLVGSKITSSGVDNTIGRDCIVETVTGERMVCVPQRGSSPGLFTLRPLDPREPDRRDVAILWAAPVTIIVRN